MNVLGNLRVSFSLSTDALVAAARKGVASARPRDSEPQPSLPPNNDHHQTASSLTGAELIESATPLPATVRPVGKSDSRRWSLQHVVRQVRKPALTATEEHEKRTQAAVAAARRAAHAPKLSSSDRRARHNASVVRNLIIGPEGISLGSKPAFSKNDVSKTRAALLEPREANKLIANLRTLPPADAPGSAAPIHAVCLPLTEAQAEELHFRRLKMDQASQGTVVTRDFDPNAAASAPATVVSASLDSISDALRDLNLVSLVESPDFGLGQPGNGNGILAGALPTAETIVNGVVQITPQLMSLGYATGKAIIPNHTGVYPPTDRMSVLTYWWGLELVMPPPTIAYLSQSQSISHTVMNFLSALALVNGGVREILPFVRYISQFVDFEFSAIKQADRGKGVVCAATWIMPAAMVPRPWDFPSPPKPTTPPASADPTATPPTAQTEGPSNVPTGTPDVPTTDQTPNGEPVQSEPSASAPDSGGPASDPSRDSTSPAPPSEPGASDDTKGTPTAASSPLELFPGVSA